MGLSWAPLGLIVQCSLVRPQVFHSPSFHAHGGGAAGKRGGRRPEETVAEVEIIIVHICAAAIDRRGKARWNKNMGTEAVKNAEKLVLTAMEGRDASHDAAHAFRVRDLALSLAKEEGLSSSAETLEIVEIAALLHDIGDHKYVSELSEEARIVERFLEEEDLEESSKERILKIIKGMGFKDELNQKGVIEVLPEFGVVQDADRLDAIGAIGIARCFTFGGSRNSVLHDPEIKPRVNLSKEEYVKKDEKQTTINHFHEKLLKLKDMMKTKAGQKRAQNRHKFMEDFLNEFYEEWDGRA
ncbi:hypothetical protein H6P81_017784 [Aristolochia fimbriata]|uniref:HD/PDEase domain-containing protein n=1 Tax=Aristolochia fimbriata TaxID=158543 RepID=A0AAV7DZ49_ARIFI|nr:hypothetical protein H6P81_017784 [Aristolochia fimbriata]